MKISFREFELQRGVYPLAARRKKAKGKRQKTVSNRS
jgi:hypothetical protein